MASKAISFERALSSDLRATPIEVRDPLSSSSIAIVAFAPAIRSSSTLDRRSISALIWLYSPDSNVSFVKAETNSRSSPNS